MHKGIIIADIHSVATDIKSYVTQMDFLLSQISYIEGLDFMIIAGDYFDKKMYMSDEKAHVAVYYLQQIIDTCIDKEIKLRIVYGTKSHEEDQYRILYHNQCKYVHFIDKVESEDLFDDMRVLYIPEEFVSNKKKHYDEYLYQGLNYDYIFGHGVIRDVMKVAANKMESSNKTKAVPTFSFGELAACCDGYVYFGHYHVRTNIHDKVFYVGSYDRLSFDDGDNDVEKGFYLTTMNNENGDKTYDHVFILNQYAKKFFSITYKADDNLYDDTSRLIEKITTMKNLIENENVEKVRMIFELPEDKVESDAFMKTVHSMVGNTKHLKVSFIDPNAKKIKDDEIVDKEISDKYAYLLDDGILPETKVSTFIETEYDTKISEEEIREVTAKK